MIAAFLSGPARTLSPAGSLSSDQPTIAQAVTPCMSTAAARDAPGDTRQSGARAATRAMIERLTGVSLSAGPADTGLIDPRFLADARRRFLGNCATQRTPDKPVD
jgi:hypothetical protein